MASKYNFLAEPDDSLKCMICIEVASDPKQHGDCGKLFCSKCLDKNGNKPCPNCRDENPQYFPDGKSLRQIRDLLVRCKHVVRGCDWEGTVGTLADHVDKCGFTTVPCPNMCNVEGEDSQLIRKDLDHHLKTTCRNRDYACENCGKKGTFASITEDHVSVCIKKVVSCPNTKCTSTMQRGLTKKHVETDCKYTVVACKYASIGCSMERTRVGMKQHEEDDKFHLRLALDKIVKLVDTTSSLEDNMSSQMVTISSLKTTTSSLEASTSLLKATTSSLQSSTFLLKVSSSSLKDTISSRNTTISSLKLTSSSLKSTTSMLKRNVYTLSRKRSITFVLPGFCKKKKDGTIFYSEPFYTSPGGYKMCIKIYPNGRGDGNGTHVSLFVQQLEGPYNDNLPRAFLGLVILEVLNQLVDKNHHRMDIPFKCSDEARNLGFSKFLPHTKLSNGGTRNTQYLMEDTLYFRVAVEVDNHKPWLDCSYHTK